MSVASVPMLLSTKNKLKVLLMRAKVFLRTHGKFGQATFAIFRQITFNVLISVVDEPKLVHYPIWDKCTLTIKPLASMHNYKKVIKVNVTVAINSGILHFLVQKCANRGPDFCHTDKS